MWSKNSKHYSITRCYIFSGYNPQGGIETETTLQNFQVSIFFIQYSYFHIYTIKIYHAYHTRSISSKPKPTITQYSMTRESIFIDPYVSPKPNFPSNSTNSTDPSQSNKSNIHNEVIASILTCLSNMNYKITIIEKFK